MAVRLLLLALAALALGRSAATAEPVSCVELAPITGESACPGRGDAWEGDAAARSPECIQFGQTYDGTAVLVNPCVECRSAAVERIDLAGNLSFQSYPVAPKSTVDLPTNGLVRARIVRDDPCG